MFYKNTPNENKQRGVIVISGSVAALDGSSNLSAFAASEGALVSMTLPLAIDLAKIGVRVVTIAPGLS